MFLRRVELPDPIQFKTAHNIYASIGGKRTALNVNPFHDKGVEMEPGGVLWAMVKNGSLSVTRYVPPPPADVQLLAEIRDLLKTRPL